MKNTSQIALTVIVGFLVTLGLNFLSGYISLDKGTILIGPVVMAQTGSYLAVDISNFTEEVINDLKVSIPSNVSIKEIVASDPLRINEADDVVGTGERKQVSISGIDHNKVTQFWIPVHRADDAQAVQVVNGPEKKLRVLSASDISYPYKAVFINALVMALVYAAAYYAFLLWMKGKHEALDERIESARKDMERFKAEDAVRQRQYADLGATTGRMKLLLFARLSDYAKELDFWRDTVRKMLYQAGENKSVAEQLLTQVSETLKTHAARTGKATDFDTIKALAVVMYPPNAQGGGEK